MFNYLLYVPGTVYVYTRQKTYLATRSKRTPLHWAAGNGQLGVIRELLFWGARVDCTDAWRKVPLHWAAFRGHVASVRELVGRGSLVGQKDADGNTPGSTFHSSVPEVCLLSGVVRLVVVVVVRRDW